MCYQVHGRRTGSEGAQLAEQILPSFECALADRLDLTKPTGLAAVIARAESLEEPLPS